MDWLARKAGYSLSHCRNVRYGSAKASEQFKARCAEALEIPAEVLFSAVPSESAAVAS